MASDLVWAFTFVFALAFVACGVAYAWGKSAGFHAGYRQGMAAARTQEGGEQPSPSHKGEAQ